MSRGWPAGHPERADRAKAVVNEVMRRGLMTGKKPVPDREPFTVESVRCGFLPGVDPLKLDQLVDELEVGEFLARTQLADAHLAALAIEHQAELHSNDTDFACFSGLTWRNPIA